MFTGIIEFLGKIKDIKGGKIYIQSKSVAGLVKLGSSVCVSGVCLTVTDIDNDVMGFDTMSETLSKTNLSVKKIGDVVNLESSLKAGDEIGGHFVYGHIDGVGEVISMEDSLLTIKLPDDLIRYMAPRGSVAIDGVSLTIARLEDRNLTVSLVGYTLENTTLDKLKTGYRVNIEADMLAKYMFWSTEV